ncbi:MAG TPA: hypothetical protein VER32_09840 [Pyrinomonadaceae bacterium]|nr:hypothetical protein [Pyrinomonadaceae bacterium]
MRTSLNNVPRSLVRYLFVGAAALSLLPAAPPARAQGDASPSSSSAAGPQKINVQPLKELLARFREIFERAGATAGAREATVEADLAEDGSFTDVRLDGAGDREFLRFASDAAAALSNSRVFSALSKEGARRVEMRLRLDAENVLASASAEVASAERAREMELGYSAMFMLARKRAEGTRAQPLWNGVRLSANGKRLMLSLDVPRETVGNLLHRQITPN